MSEYSSRGMETLMEDVRRFIGHKLRLKGNKAKSRVALTKKAIFSDTPLSG